MFIMGSTIINWIKLLWKQRIGFSWKKLDKFFIITAVILLLSPFSFFEKLRYNRKINQTHINKPPIFILGHWRSGTTHLHNLLIQDPNLAYANLIDVTFPNHNMSGKRFIRPLFARILPEKRPMDDMDVYVDFPGEHDWAISSLCLLSPYTGAYYPNQWEQYFKYIDFEDATDKEKETYSRVLRYYLKKLTLKYNGRQLVLKSPMDTGRVKLLAEIFPTAKFIHIYRDPYEVYFSTLKLHKANQEVYAFHQYKRSVPEFTLQAYIDLYESLYRDLATVPQDNYVEVSYEMLKQDRVGTLRNIYEKLELVDFETNLPKLEKYIASLDNYKIDKYDISPKDRQMIYDRWHKLIDRWGYENPLVSGIKQ